MMKQFAQRTLIAWQNGDSFADEDRLIEEYIQYEGNGD